MTDLAPQCPELTDVLKDADHIPSLCDLTGKRRRKAARVEIALGGEPEHTNVYQISTYTRKHREIASDQLTFSRHDLALSEVMEEAQRLLHHTAGMHVDIDSYRLVDSGRTLAAKVLVEERQGRR